MNEPEANGSLWDEIAIPVGHGLRCQLGSFQLSVFRQDGEWHLAHENALSDETGPGVSRVSEISEAPPENLNLMRFAATRATSVLRLVPRAADRSVVAKPYPPLHLLATEDTKIYVSSPVWLDVTVGNRQHSLCELPVRTLSDTWFGSNTLEGDVAYALRTRARGHLAAMPMRTYRIITPVNIRNTGEDTLLIDRINLPVPYLSVYSARERFLWTESVTLVRSQGTELASMEIGKGPPQEAVGAKRLSSPRQALDDNFFVKAFISLLAPFQQEI